MPRGDETGPVGGGGPGTGRGMGMGQGKGRGRMNGSAMGTGGSCVCPSCGKQIAHQRGTPCNQVKCPGCGATMSRQQ